MQNARSGTHDFSLTEPTEPQSRFYFVQHHDDTHRLVHTPKELKIVIGLSAPAPAKPAYGRDRRARSDLSFCAAGEADSVLFSSAGHILQPFAALSATNDPPRYPCLSGIRSWLSRVSGTQAEE